VTLMIDLRGHAALVTGSTQGVGRSLAQSLATAGANVVIHGHQAASFAAPVLEHCRALGVQAEFVSGDLAGPTEACVDAVFRAATSAMPEIDILVNNAGGLFDVPFLEMTHERYEQTMRLNVAAPYFLTRTFAQRWVRSGVNGRVLFTGSINGRLAEPMHTAYDLSKGAIETMVKTLCVALAPLGIRVNGMAPGLVRTPLTSVALDGSPRFAQWMELHTPSGQVPHSDVCGPAAAFLVSDLAQHIHGQMLLVDGGMSAWQQPDPPTTW
jgi:NAD(P)-dependent dehydrogenase (short-subunit alcohol dehydrogenase family)